MALITTEMAGTNVMAEPGSKTQTESSRVLGVGVVGLGPCWRHRYWPALRALPRLFRLVAVYDQVTAKARREALRCRCNAAAGPTALIERPDVDVLLLLDRQWFGLWPLEVARRMGKPVYCRQILVYKDPHAPNIARRVQESLLPVMVDLPAPPGPALSRVRELLASQLGMAKRLLGYVLSPAKVLCTGNQGEIRLARLIRLLGWCVALLGEQPVRLWASRVDNAGIAGLLLDYGDSRAAQLTMAAGPARTMTWQLTVLAEHGTAFVEPSRLRWRGPEGNLCLSLPHSRPGPGAFLEGFHHAVSTGQAPQAGLPDALRWLRWLYLAKRSLAEGGWINLGA
jgi:hypothetical protein